MKAYQIILFVFLFIFPKQSFGQDKKLKDLDGDKINDSIIYHRQSSIVACKLSKQNFQEIRTQKINSVDIESSGIELTKNGFQFYNSFMREGYACQFRYDKKAGKIQLIGMNRYRDGNAEHSGSGESSVNLLTGIYVGNWNYFDRDSKKLIKIPTIKEKYNFPKTYFEDFSQKQPEKYGDYCDKIYSKYENK